MQLAGEGGPVALEHLRQVLLGYGLTGHMSNQVRVPACAANCILFSCTNHTCTCMSSEFVHVT